MLDCRDYRLLAREDEHAYVAFGATQTVEAHGRSSSLPVLRHYITVARLKGQTRTNVSASFDPPVGEREGGE